MKSAIFLGVFLVSELLFAQAAAKCEPNGNLTRNAKEIKAVSCEEINRNGQCKEATPVDTNAMRKIIEGQLNFTTDPKRVEDLKRNWSFFVKANPWAEKFYGPRYNSESRLPAVPVLDWFADPAFAENAKSVEEYKKAFVDKYVAFGQKMDCQPTFRASDKYIESHPTIKQLNVDKMGREQREFNLRNMRKEMADPKNVQAVRERLKKISDESLDNFLICTSKPELEVRTAVSLKFQPCAGNFKKNFENNKYDVNSTELNKILETAEAKEVSACINQRLAQGAKLHHISISSSASSLNNTGEAESRFCKKGFLALSEARAETAKNKILPALFAKAGQAGFDPEKVKVEINAAGANGDGTSGDCPYETKNGREVLKARYASKTGQAELEDSKYVKVQVTFEDGAKKLSENIPSYQPMYRCKKIEFKCE